MLHNRSINIFIFIFMKKIRRFTGDQIRINAFMTLLPRIKNFQEFTTQYDEPGIYLEMNDNYDIAIIYKSDSARNHAFDEFKEESENFLNYVKEKMR